MKNVFFLVLIALVVIPAFTPWIPHEAAQALHSYQERHHQNLNQSAAHTTQLSTHHTINLDAVSYFSDYLHVDLQSPALIVLKAPVPVTYNIDFTAVAVVVPSLRYELAFMQSRAPPDWLRLRPENTPLFLSTQRIRI